jgi:hypothetical protein
MSYYTDRTERIRIRHSAFHLKVFCVFVASGNRLHVRHSAYRYPNRRHDILTQNPSPFLPLSNVLDRDRGGIFEYEGIISLLRIRRNHRPSTQDFQ